MAKSDGRRFGLIVIGDEILSGRRQDKHLAKMIELLSERGLSLSWARYVADDPEQIIDTLKQSFASGDVVFSTGGLVQHRTITRAPQQLMHWVCNWHCIHKQKSSLRHGLWRALRAIPQKRTYSGLRTSIDSRWESFRWAVRLFRTPITKFLDLGSLNITLCRDSQ